MGLSFFYIRDIANDGRISTQYVPTNKQLADIADIGTKFPRKQRHRNLINSITNIWTGTT